MCEGLSILCAGAVRGDSGSGTRQLKHHHNSGERAQRNQICGRGSSESHAPALMNSESAAE